MCKLLEDWYRKWPQFIPYLEHLEIQLDHSNMQLLFINVSKLWLTYSCANQLVGFNMRATLTLNGLNSGYNEYILHTFMLAYRRGGCSWKPLTSITKCSILDIAAALDSPVYREFKSTWNNTQRVKGKLKGIQGTSKNITYI